MTTSPPADPKVTDWAGVALGLALAALAAFQMLKLAPALPLMIASYDYPYILAGAMMSIYAAAGLLLTPLFGRLMERWPGLVLGGGFGALALGNIVVLAGAEQGAVALTGRGFEGVGYAILGLAGPVIANRSANTGDLSVVAGLVATWIPTGQVVALAIAWPFLDAGLWQPIWWAALILTGLVAGWLWLRRRVSLPLITMSLDGAAQTRPNRREWAILIVTAGVFGLWAGQYLAFMTWLPKNLVSQHGLGADTAALINLVPVLGVLIMCVMTGFLLRAKLPFTALLFGATALQVPIWLFAHAMGPVAGLAAIALYGIAGGITPVCLFAVPARLLGGDRVNPSAFAPIMSGRNLGGLAAPVALGALIGDNDWAAVWPAFAAVSAVAALGALWIGLALDGAKYKAPER